MKILVALALSLCTAVAQADVLEVNIWKPAMGGMPGTIAAAQEGKAIIEEAGGNVSIGIDLDGSLHFVTYHDNWADWASLQGKMSESAAWNNFVGRWMAAPSAELADNYLLDAVVSDEGGDVYQVSVWEAMPGGSTEMFMVAARAAEIHKKMGAAVSIFADQMGRLHYAMNFEDWDAWAKFQDTESAEWAAFWAEIQKDPKATLMHVYTASELD